MHIIKLCAAFFELKCFIVSGRLMLNEFSLSLSIRKTLNDERFLD
jgi:hypothetical protein